MASEENIAPRHGRHAAVSSQEAPTTEEQSTMPAHDIDEDFAGGFVGDTLGGTPVEPKVQEPPMGVIPNIVTVGDGDQEFSWGDAPRPIGVDPGETGSFQRIDASEGARLTTRANASETASFRAQNVRPVETVRMSTAGRPHVEHRDIEVKSNKRVFIVLGIAAFIVVAIVGTLLVRALISMDRPHETPVVEQTQAAADGSIEYRGTTYAIAQQESGPYALVSTSEGSQNAAVVLELAGTPVALILYNTVFVIPENLPDGTWDLIAHPLGGGSVTQQVTDADGNPIIGTGEISSATLDGDGIQISTTAGEELTISLV